ncbi:DNA-processing protein DprA [Advenella alkanexedens]|uniref:DNA-processing protein DprA n=1 Tax=Advenella alkanexedens TaxID=1481665 RepID=A0ABS6NKX7_9BURK|nr:DNA-processing protein DprA [Advenella alkanexedens]MBV4396282.1 DNA-processing protein DprA [Advenella alkanexedens]
MSLMRSQEELQAWLRLTLEPGVGPVTARQLLAVFGLPEQVFAASVGQLMKYLPQKLALQLAAEPEPDIQGLIQKTFEWLARPGHYILTLADPLYPKALFDTHDPPVLLYVDGRPEVLAMPTIAMVGARNATMGGCDNARAFAKYLAGQGWCVVSGLAHGIDAAAHEGALQAPAGSGSTIAVMGTGINRLYPAANKNLALRIREQGALVSELPLDTPAVVHQFPRRNRIVAGLSKGVLVVEAAKQSGSLITARLAGEMGREVFAIPGSIHSPLSRGCHALIRQGAKLVETAMDIQEELAGIPANKLTADTGIERVVGKGRGKGTGTITDQTDGFVPDPEQCRLLERMGFEPLSLDELVSDLRIGVSEVSSQLLALELAAYIVRLNDGRYQRVR